MTTPKTGSPEWAGSQATPHTTVNEALRRIEGGARLFPVVDKDLTTPPGACVDGACYIVAGGGGAWAGHIGDIAQAVGANAANGWYFQDPEDGVFAWVQDEGLLYRCTTGTSPASWSPFSIAHTHTASDITDLVEAVQDIVGAMTVAGANVTVSYDDSSGLLTISATGGGGSGGTSAFVTPPQGRLTLTSLTPVMTADVTGASALYYTPYLGEFIPIYESGSPLGWTMTEFSQLTVNLDASSSPPLQASGALYDVFVWNDSGTIRGGFGPAWSSATARGTGAGTTELELKDGIWTNKNSITLNNGATTYAGIPANEATYVGTAYCTANGQTGMAMHPAAAAGGAAPILAVSNAYNRVPVGAVSQDNTASWTYNSTTVRAANGSANNRISFVDGLAQSCIDASYSIVTTSGAAGNGGIALTIDATNSISGQAAQDGGNAPATITARHQFAPVLGLHYVQAVEFAPTGTPTYFGALASPTRVANALNAHLMM